VPGQKVTLTLEIATDRWFAGGTRIGIPEVPGLVILQTEQFASNASETHNGRPGQYSAGRWMYFLSVRAISPSVQFLCNYT